MAGGRVNTSAFTMQPTRPAPPTFLVNRTKDSPPALWEAMDTCLSSKPPEAQSSAILEVRALRNAAGTPRTTPPFPAETRVSPTDAKPSWTSSASRPSSDTRKVAVPR